MTNRTEGAELAYPNATAPAETSVRRGRRRMPGSIRASALKAVPLLVVLTAWVVVTELASIDPLFLPGPELVWKSLVTMLPELPGAIAYSMGTLLTGFAFGTAGAILLGLAMAYSSAVRFCTESIVDALRPIPVFALIPLFVLWLGIGRPPQILLVAFGCFVIVIVSTSEAIKNVPHIYLDAAATLGASRARVYRTVVVPAITPQILGGIRAAAAAAFGLEVAAELIGAQNGVGHIMVNNQLYLRTEGILIAVAIFTLLALALDLLIRVLSGRLVRWSDRNRR